MLQNIYLSTVLAFGLFSCSQKSESTSTDALSKRLEDILIKEDVTGDGRPDIIRLRKEKEVNDTFGATYIFEPGIYLAICEGEARSGEFLYDPREIEVYDFLSNESRRNISETIRLQDTNNDGIKDIVYGQEGEVDVERYEDTNSDGVMETFHEKRKIEEVVFPGKKLYPYFYTWIECPRCDNF